MTAADTLDAMNLRTCLALWGRPATLYPMKPGPAGVNGPAVADPDRAVLTGIAVIRSEWSERVQIGGLGMPTPTGNFRLPAAGRRHIATLAPDDIALLPGGWMPRKGDQVAYDDRPDARYQVSEPMPDGGAGLHLGLTAV